MNWRAVRAIARKDMKSITANFQVWMPMAIVPLLLGVVLPGVVVGLLAYGLTSAADLGEMIGWLKNLPLGGLQDQLAAFPKVEQQLIYLITNYMLVGLFLMVPLMTSSVIAADSMAGEKERGTLETLLFAPVDLLSLLVGKVLASLIPTLVVSFGTLLLGAVVVNGLGWPLFGQIFFPTVNWVPLMLLVLPMISLATIIMNVFISARVATFQAAYQLGGVAVLPAILLVVGQATGLVLLGTWVLVGVGLGFGLLNLILVWQVMKRLDRNRLFESQVR